MFGAKQLQKSIVAELSTIENFKDITCETSHKLRINDLENKNFEEDVRALTRRSNYFAVIGVGDKMYLLDFSNPIKPTKFYETGVENQYKISNTSSIDRYSTTLLDDVYLNYQTIDFIYEFKCVVSDDSFSYHNSRGFYGEEIRRTFIEYFDKPITEDNETVYQKLYGSFHDKKYGELIKNTDRCVQGDDIKINSIASSYIDMYEGNVNLEGPKKLFPF